MRLSTRIAAISLSTVAAVSLAAHRPPPDALPTAQPAPAAAPSATIDSLAFLAGSWSGDMGGYVEENWSRPQGTSIVGTFRWLKKNGSPSMFEMLAITREDDAIRLRLRHYSPTLNAKEDADKPLTYRLKEVSGARAVFEAEKDPGSVERIVYAVEDDALAIDVIFKPEEGKPARDPLNFRLKRTGF